MQVTHPPRSRNEPRCFVHFFFRGAGGSGDLCGAGRVESWIGVLRLACCADAEHAKQRLSSRTSMSPEGFDSSVSLTSWSSDITGRDKTGE